jgi:hypothetical protein
MNLYDTPRFGMIDADFLPRGEEYVRPESNLPQRLMLAAVWIIVILLALRYIKR